LIRPAPAGPLATLAAAALIALLAACGKGDAGSSEGGPLPAGFERVAAGARLAPPAVTDRCYSPPTRMVFHSKAEWDTYWFEVTRQCPPPAVPGNVDFGKEMLVYASMGRRMSAEDRMTIEGTGTRGDTLLVFIRRSMRAAGCPGREKTFPQSLIRIPAGTRPVRFAEEHRKVPCS
jgi:hypothetical protein